MNYKELEEEFTNLCIQNVGFFGDMPEEIHHKMYTDYVMFCQKLLKKIKEDELLRSL